MRAIILLFAILLIGYSASAQKTLSKNVYSFYIDGESSDTASSASETIAKVIYLYQKPTLQFYSIAVGLDSLSGSTSVTTYLDRSYDNGTTYYNISSLAFAMSQSDTVLLFQDVSTGTDAALLRVRTVGASSTKVGLDYIYGRITDKP